MVNAFSLLPIKFDIYVLPSLKTGILCVALSAHGF